MITKNPKQLKAFINKKSQESRIFAQLDMQNYMMERLLERISLSPYKQNFILKGVFLIAAIVGLDSRTTMDLDTTVKGLPLTHESLSKVFEEICAISLEDDIAFSLIRITDIREVDDYWICIRFGFNRNRVLQLPEPPTISMSLFLAYFLVCTG